MPILAPLVVPEKVFKPYATHMNRMHTDKGKVIQESGLTVGKMKKLRSVAYLLYGVETRPFRGSLDKRGQSIFQKVSCPLLITFLIDPQTGKSNLPRLLSTLYR